MFYSSTLEDMKLDEELPQLVNKFVKLFDPLKLIRPKATELTNLDNHMLINSTPFNHKTVLAIETFLNAFQKPLCFVAHNGNIFDFPILFNEIQSAFSLNNNSYISEIDTNENTVINKNNSSDQTLITSIACTDSLNFFREMYRLLNDKDIVRYPNDDNKSASSFDSSLSTIRRGYVEIPVKSSLTRQLPSMKLINIYEREFNRISNLRSHHAEDDCLMLLAVLKRYLPDWLEWMEINHRPLRDFSLLPSIKTTTTTKTILPKNNVNIKRPLKF